MLLCATLGLPLTAVAVVGAVIHCMQDERFNNELLLDLASRTYDHTVTSSPVPALEMAIGD